MNDRVWPRVAGAAVRAAYRAGVAVVLVLVAAAFLWGFASALRDLMRGLNAYGGP